jgi:hypothetical protein
MLFDELKTFSDEDVNVHESEFNNHFLESLGSILRGHVEQTGVFERLKGVSHVANGMLHLDELDKEGNPTLKSFAPEYYSRNASPIAWNKDAQLLGAGKNGFRDASSKIICSRESSPARAISSASSSTAVIRNSRPTARASRRHGRAPRERAALALLAAVHQARALTDRRRAFLQISAGCCSRETSPSSTR